MLDPIELSEGADKGRGYNEMPGYGIMLDGEVSKSGRATDKHG